MALVSRLILVALLAGLLLAQGAAAEPEPPAKSAEPEATVAPSAEDSDPREGNEDNEGFARTGGYLGVFGLAALEDLKGQLHATSDSTWGLGLRAGVRGDRYWAAELQFEWIDGFDIRGTSGDVDGYAVTANGRAFLVPGSGRIQPFALVGIGWGEYEVEHDNRFNLRRDDFVARFGGGLELYLTDYVAFTFDANYLLGTGDVSDVRYTSLAGGILARF